MLIKIKKILYRYIYIYNMSYWQAIVKKPVITEKVSYPTTNGLSYKASGNNKILINIPSDCKFIQPSDTYLKFKLDLDFTQTHASAQHALGSIKQRLQLIPELGGSAIIKNLVIRSGTGRTLESITNANALNAIRLMYNKDSNLDAKRSSSEGVVIHDFRTRSWGNSGLIEKLNSYNTSSNPYFDKDGNTSVNLVIPFHCSGLLGAINTKILPVGLLQGMVIELELEEPRYCWRAIQSTARDGPNPGGYNLLLSHGNGGNAGAGLAKATSYSSIFTHAENNNGVIADCPFCVGELLGVRTAANTSLTIGKITAIATATGGAYEISFTAATANGQFTPTDDIANKVELVSNGFHDANTTITTFDYTVSDVEIILKKCYVEPAMEKAMERALQEKGSIIYPYGAYMNYQKTVNKEELQPTMDILFQNKLGKAVLHQPTTDNVSDVECLTNFLNETTPYFRLCGDRQRMGDYSVFMGGRQNPDRAIETRKTTNTNGYNQRALSQLSQALSQSDIPVTSLLNAKNNFIVGKPFTIGNAVHDISAADYQVKFTYDVSSTKNKNFNNFVYSIQNLIITNESIERQL
tara:strand:- start:5993 stop:7732 length:1740 start_codon:yes stop_codon:yes gene_type:complete